MEIVLLTHGEWGSRISKIRGADCGSFKKCQVLPTASGLSA